MDVQGEDATKSYSPVRCNKLISSDHNNLDDNYWFSEARELVWMSYAESRFMLAEAALRNWTTGSVEQYYIDGIRASMDYYNIDDDIAARCRVSPRWDATADDELKLERIITQKWISIFPNGNEGWAEFRRTDYPELLNIEENNSDGDVPEGKFIKRIKYPQSESFNPNRPMGDNQGTKIWWDVADTNNDNGQRVQPNNFR